MQTSALPILLSSFRSKTWRISHYCLLSVKSVNAPGPSFCVATQSLVGGHIVLGEPKLYDSIGVWQAQPSWARSFLLYLKSRHESNKTHARRNVPKLLRLGYTSIAWVVSHRHYDEAGYTTNSGNTSKHGCSVLSWSHSARHVTIFVFALSCLLSSGRQRWLLSVF